VTDAQELSSLAQTAVGRSWAPYRTARIDTRQVHLERVKPLARSVHRSRLASAGEILSGLRAEGVPPFVCHFRATQDGVFVRFPPVLEQHDDRFLIVDGMHRLMAAAGSGEDEVTAIVVSSPSLPPPTVPPCEWGDVAVVDAKPPRAEKFPGYVAELFRPTAKVLDGLCGPYESDRRAVESLRRAVSAVG